VSTHGTYLFGTQRFTASSILRVLLHGIIPTDSSILNSSIRENTSASKVYRVETRGRNKTKQKIVLVAAKFAFDNKFKARVDRYCKRLKKLKFFQENQEDRHELFCYGEPPDFVLQNKKFSRHMRFLTDPNDASAKGGGYWFHKAVLLQHHMDRCNDGDFLIWTDVDRIDFVRNTKSFAKILKTLAKRDDDLCIETMAYAEEVYWSKEDILAAFNASESLRESLQQSASAIVLRRSPRMKMFIDAWVECVSDWHMLSDEPSILPNSPAFDENRHDQSILSMLIKTFMARQDSIGPPAQAYHDDSEFRTYKLLNSVDPSCPFSLS
jgi:hypothetical protein